MNSPRNPLKSLLPLALAASLLACGGTDPLGTGASSSASSTTQASSVTTGTSGVGGAGGAGATSGVGGAGGEGGAALHAEAIVDALKADLQGTLRAHAADTGWPVPTAEGHLFVSTLPGLDHVAGDHDAWAGTPMTQESGFAWVVITVPADDHYKLTDKTTYAADPWSRSYDYDQFGEISIADAALARLDRFFFLGDAANDERTVRVWVPGEPVSHVLYVHDGQNLFDPEAFFGGWHLHEGAPPGMLLVGIDNTSARMDEYTHVPDDIGSGPLGGEGDAYAAFVEGTVRPLVKQRYGETGPIGVMGSSLGGLISLHMADRAPGAYAFAASLSGTVGWGSIGANNETMIERLGAHGHQSTVLYVDSGGEGTCYDSDGDGIEDDDPSAGDNYCENLQLANVLEGVGYVDGVDYHYWYEPGAQHNEAEWAARVFRPLGIFAGL